MKTLFQMLYTDEIGDNEDFKYKFENLRIAKRFLSAVQKDIIIMN